MRIAQSLLDDISSGRYKIGNMLPTEEALCREFSVSRYTVREALRQLREMGVVVRSQGVGTRVRALSATAQYVQSLASLADLTQYAKGTRLQVTSTRDVLAEGSLCELLRCDPGQRWLEVNALRFASDDRVPIAMTSIYVPATFAGLRQRIGSVHQPVYKLIEQQYGETIAEVEQELGAISINAAAARAFKIKPGAAGLLIVRRYYGESGSLLEVAVNTHPPVDYYRYTMRLRLDRKRSK